MTDANEMTDDEWNDPPMDETNETADPPVPVSVAITGTVLVAAFVYDLATGNVTPTSIALLALLSAFTIAHRRNAQA